MEAYIRLPTEKVFSLSVLETVCFDGFEDDGRLFYDEGDKRYHIFIDEIFEDKYLEDGMRAADNPVPIRVDDTRVIVTGLCLKAKAEIEALQKSLNLQKAKAAREKAIEERRHSSGYSWDWKQTHSGGHIPSDTRGALGTDIAARGEVSILDRQNVIVKTFHVTLTGDLPKRDFSHLLEKWLKEQGHIDQPEPVRVEDDWEDHEAQNAIFELQTFLNKNGIEASFDEAAQLFYAEPALKEAIFNRLSAHMDVDRLKELL